MEFRTDLQLSKEERDYIIAELAKDTEPIEYVKVWQEGNELVWQPFYKRHIKRIRRITGYFSTVDRFNDAKKAELQDRVAHA